MRATWFTALSLLLLGAAGLSSCSRLARPAATPVGATQFTPAAETGPYVVIGHLQHRDRFVTIKSGDQGTVYSVQDKNGKLMFENLTAAQLKTQAPEIHEFIETPTALSGRLIETRPAGQAPRIPPTWAGEYAGK